MPPDAANAPTLSDDLRKLLRSIVSYSRWTSPVGFVRRSTERMAACGDVNDVSDTINCAAHSSRRGMASRQGA